MKILFICSSLEHGKDGVGDYTRKLACALIRHGHNAAIIAINDRRMTGNAREEKQSDNNTAISVLRLPESNSWKHRLNIAKNFADAFNADWVSLQYVPFGFQVKGLPFNLGKKLNPIAGKCRWHIMFHELSVNKNESLKFRAWAFLQIKIINSILQTLKPALITTNTEIYRQRLQQMGYSAKLLPLFSNINKTTTTEKDFSNDGVPAEIVKNRQSHFIGTIFGSFFFKSWDLHSLLSKLIHGNQNKKIIIVSIGIMSFGNEYWKTLKKSYPEVNFLTLGDKSEAFISWWLSYYTDFGILTTPPELASKSGSFMAFKEHGIPVLCKEPDEQLKKHHIKLDGFLTVITKSNDLIIPEKLQPVSLLEQTVYQFQQLLNQ